MPTPTPKVGEIWRVELEPVRGSEQGKMRPVVVVSEPPVGRASIRLCVPVMNTLPIHGSMFWCLALVPNEDNGLTKNSTVDAAQIRALDTERFQAHLGRVDPDELESITGAICLCVGRQPLPLNTSDPSDESLDVNESEENSSEAHDSNLKEKDTNQ